MPEADPFNALGAGNGFPYCPPRVNVDDTASLTYEWVTLGGTKKGDALTGATFEEQKNESLRVAMRYLWNLYSCETRFEYNEAFSVVSGEFIFPHELDRVPKIRVCGGDSSYMDDEDPRREGDGTIDREGNTDYDYLVDSGISTARIIRMYVNDNFIGYGLRGMTSELTTGAVDVAFLNGNNGLSMLTVGSYFRRIVNDPFNVTVSDYLNWGSMPIVAVYSFGFFTFNPEVIQDTDGETIIANSHSNGSSANRKFTIGPPGFYTYP